MWFPERGEPLDVARKVCAGCVVRSECADYGRGEHYGIWGGTSENERRRIRRARARQREAVAMEDELLVAVSGNGEAPAALNATGTVDDPSVLSPRTCRQCGEPLDGRPAATVFCSNRCGKRWRYAHREEEPAPETSTVPGLFDLLAELADAAPPGWRFTIELPGPVVTASPA
jgi:hypothetical protein